MQTIEATLESKVHTLVNEDMLNAFWDAVDYFKTKDLVVFYDTNKLIDPITVYERKKFLIAPGVPDSLKKKFNKPASDTSDLPHDSDSAFWLLAAFSEGELASAAIGTPPLIPSNTQH